MKTTFAILLVVFTATIHLRAQENERDSPTELGGSATAYYVKMMCSCLFVIRQSREFCQNYSRTLMAMRSVFIEDNAVSAGVLAMRRRARFVNSDLGCVLE